MTHLERITALHSEMWDRAKEDLIVQGGGRIPSASEVADHVMQTQILVLRMMLLPTEQDQLEYYELALKILKGGKAREAA